jgi:uncharacterized membrane protein YkgB
MDAISGLSQRLAYPLLRITMGIVLFWIGALKFIDPSPVVELLGASLSFLAFPAFVYLLGAVEVVLAIMLFARIAVRYAGLALMGLFSGTILIFLIAPMVAYGPGGFPRLSLPGEFLLKDLVLFAASLAIVALETSQMPVAERRMRGAHQYAPAK